MPSLYIFTELVLIPCMQAPGAARWQSVKHLIHPPASQSLATFVRSLQLKPVGLASLGDVEIDEQVLMTIVRNYETPCRHQCRGDEKVIQPAIHSILDCAALSAANPIGRAFTVLAEPMVFKHEGRQLADEAVFYDCSENGDVVGLTLRQQDVVRILVKGKGQKTFPYQFATMS